MENRFKQGRAIEILLVEDNPGDARLCLEALKESKLTNNLHLAVDGEEAMEFLLKTGKFELAPMPDLILLDLNLPKKDGREVLKEIKQNQVLAMIPVVILTSSTAEDDIVKTYGLHANCYVKKPLDFDRFVQVVQAIEGFWFEIVKLPTDRNLQIEN
jgi:two-component system, chemotaxis family, response regulator Rcp1